MNGGTQILFSNIDYDQFVGRIGVGRVERGEVKVGMPVVVCSRDGSTKNARITKLFQYQGLKKLRQKQQNWAILLQLPALLT